MIDWLLSLPWPTWVSIGSAVVSLASLYFNWSRAAAARENNIISGTNAWAQALMKYVEQEIAYAFRDEQLMKSIFQRKFQTVDEKLTVRNELNAVREQSSRNLEFLSALSGKSEGLIEARARLSKVYDSFMESSELQVSDEGRKVLEKYNLLFKTYLGEIRAFALSLGVERGAIVLANRNKEMGPVSPQ